MEREKQVVQHLRDGNVTFSKAAEIAETSVWNIAALTDEDNVTWVSDEHLESDLREL